MFMAVVLDQSRVMLYGSETWAMTKKDEDIVRKCDRRTLRYMARVKWQDGVSSQEVAKRCGLGIYWRELNREDCNGLDM